MSNFKKRGQSTFNKVKSPCFVRHTWDEAAAAADVVTVPGVKAGDVVVATINVRGANNPTTVLSAEVTATNAVTVTLDQNGEDEVTEISVAAFGV